MSLCPGVPTLPLLTLETRTKPESLGSGEEEVSSEMGTGGRGSRSLVLGLSLCWLIHTHVLGTGNSPLVTILEAVLPRGTPQTLNAAQPQDWNPELLVGKCIVRLIKESESLDLAAIMLS